MLRNGGRRLDAIGRIGPGACVLVAPAEPGARAGFWQVTAAMGAPRLIASAAGLCPRGLHPHAGVAMPVPTEMLDTVAGMGGLDEAVEALAEAMGADGFPAAAVRAILSDASLFWAFVLVMPGEAVAAAVISVVDTSDHGLWLVLDGGPVASLLTAASPTVIWRVLCEVFARDPVPANSG